MIPAALDCPLLVYDTGPLKGQKARIRRTLKIGRHPGNDISIEDVSASRWHARIELLEGGLAVVDAESGNGTYVNGERVVGQARLRAGDRIRIGQMEFLIAEPDGG